MLHFFVPQSLPALLLCLALTAFDVAPAQAFDLSILHTNDTHAAYGGFTADGRPCYAAQCPGGTGGSVRLYQAVRAVQQQKPDTLLLDAGDQFQGTLFYTQHKAAVPAAVLDKLGYTAMTPGNHEFDNGCEGFFALAENLDVPLLAANLSLPAPASVRPWIVVERPDSAAPKGVRRIGIVGLVSPATPTQSSPCAEARFLPAEPALRQAVQELQKQGVDIIIALTHLGLNEDQRLAAAVDGVDIFVGGHSHSLLSNSNKKAVGPYPVVVTSPSGAPVLIVTARYSGELLGQLNASFNADGIATVWNGDPIRLDDATVQKLLAGSPLHAAATAGLADLTACVNDFAAPLTTLLQNPVGKLVRAKVTPQPVTSLSTALDLPDNLICRAQECLTGDLITDSMLWGGQALGAQAALFVGGGIRASLHYGEVTMGDLLTTMPYENLLVVGAMPGRLLLDTLEHGIATYGSGAGRFLQVAGIRYTFDPARPAGQRLLTATIAQPDGSFQPIAPATVYRIATVDYMTQGGNGYAMLGNIKWDYAGSTQSEIIRDYIAEHSPLSVTPDKRIGVMKGE